ncbi:MAG TPA: M20/M25/M40 family metallo-hydrolase [Fimbriimonas sp.]
MAIANAQVDPWIPKLDEETRSAMQRVQPNSLKGHVSFLSSDLLLGRETPSVGLDLAAEYIAAQFRRAGIEPAAKDGYFQVAPWPLEGTPKTKVRNVVGILRGSDTFLRETYVLVSAHYDHLGTRAEAKDKVFNGANDNGSGTAGVIELAQSLAAMKTRPKRSIVFALWFGEEKGLQGSRYYGKNPLFPIDKTVAMINLEQIGRTDDADTVRKKALSMTGYDYSDLGPILRESARATGIEVEKHPVNSDAYFARSDNQAFADLGVPAHTVCTTFTYPDYHQAGDEWEKLDYDNMAAVLKGVLVGLVTLSDTIQEPRWNAKNPKAERYAAARAARKR